MSKENRRGDLKQDDIVASLVDDPSKLPKVKMFVGLLGMGARDGLWRIYASTDVKDYIEVRDEDVLMVRSLKTGENPLGGSAVWLRADADVKVTRQAPAGSGEEFLTGGITARFLKGAAPGGIGVGSGTVVIGGIKSIPPVESCVPALCLPPPPPPDPPGTTAVCTLATNCKTEFLCF
ncbi:MAG TPA: hypothetical protein VGX71_06090 [Pseudaminobacter sp.]|nr:hypothetical protein [Pseudaminobacter sp.]